MSIWALCVLMAISQTSVESRPLPEWFRVYTFEESIVELNTDYVMFSDRKTGRVRFRWSFFKPEGVGKESSVPYQTRLEEIECDCQNKRFRFYEVQLYDAGAKLQGVEDGDAIGGWRKVRFGSMMEKLFIPACQLIERRRREPAVER